MDPKLEFRVATTTGDPQALTAGRAWADLSNVLMQFLTADEVGNLTSEVTQILASPVEVDLDEVRRLAGLPYDDRPTREQLAVARLKNLVSYFQRRRELLDGALTAPKVAQLLGVSRQTPHDRRDAGTLLGVLEQGRWLFPAWQFDAAGPDGVIAQFPAVLAELEDVNPLSVCAWMTTPQPLLGDHSPIEALRESPDEVIVEARAFSASAAAAPGQALATA